MYDYLIIFSNFAPEKSETGTAFQATILIFRSRSATLFCNRLTKVLIIKTRVFSTRLTRKGAINYPEILKKYI